MNKKAFVFLYICTVGFIIAIMLFYGSAGKNQPGGKTLYLGETEIHLFELYQQAEQDNYYITLAAQLSADQAAGDFQTSFESTFNKYLAKKSLSVQDFNLQYITKGEKTTVIGKSMQPLHYTQGSASYNLTASFRVTASAKV